MNKHPIVARVAAITSATTRPRTAGAIEVVRCPCAACTRARARSSGAIDDSAKGKAAPDAIGTKGKPPVGGLVVLAPQRVPDDADINYMANPFALASIAAPGEDLRGRRLGQLSSLLSLSLAEIFAARGSPLRKDVIADAAALGQAFAPDASWRPADPARTGNPRADPWEPPLIDGRTVYEIDRASWDYAAPMFDGEPSFADVAQGAVPNCNFLSSLAAVAFVSPSSIRRRAFAPVSPPGERLRQIALHNGTTNEQVFVSERVPRYAVRWRDGRRGFLLPCAQNTWSAQGAAFSAWPAVYEKACAQMGLRVTHDRPSLMLPNYWIPAGWGSDNLPTATVHPITGLTGLPTLRADTATMSAMDMWAFVTERTEGGNARVPMICGTVEASALTPAQWDRLQLVPEHAYSVLGTIESGGGRYVVLRNPWGDYQPQGDGTLSGTWNGHALGARGLFAYELSRFRDYFGAGPRCRFYVATRG